jgi:hypothetical protein
MLALQAGRHALSGLIPHDHCRLRRNQFLACFGPILGERLFSVIDRRVALFCDRYARQRQAGLKYQFR